MHLPFTNRDRELGSLTDAVLAIGNGSHQVRAIAGVSGQGKSQLKDEFARRVRDDPSLSHVRLGLVDFYDAGSARSVIVPLHIRNALAESGLLFPAFDTAFELYWKEAHPNQELPIKRSRWLDIAGEFVGDSGADALRAGADSLKDVIEVAVEIPAISLVAILLKKLGGWSLKKTHQKYMLRAVPALRSLLRRGRDLMRANEIEKLLPELLATDIERWCEDHPDERLLVLIDEYERILNHGGAGSPIYESDIDRATRELIARCKRTLFVFFSREKLRWDTVDPDEWADALLERQSVLAGLSRNHALDCLRASNVQDNTTRETMVANALVKEPHADNETAYPVMLFLQVELYRSHIERGREITPASFHLPHPDFRGKCNELIRRLVRSYRPEINHTLTRLSVARAFDKDVFKFVVREFQTGLPADEWKNICNLSIIDEDKNDSRFRLYHDIIREGLQLQLSDEERRETHSKLANYYIDRANAGEPRAVSIDELRCVHEAFYHLSNVDSDKALDWWWKEGASKFRALGVGRAIEGIDRDAVGLATKKLPFLAHYLRAQRGLGVNLLQQGRHGEAEPIWKMLAQMVRDLGADPETRAEECNTVGLLLTAQGKYIEARGWHEEVITVLFSRNEPFDERLLNAYMQLASNFMISNEFDNAINYFDEARAVAIQIFGPTHYRTAECLSELAFALDEKNQFHLARPLHEIALGCTGVDSGCPGRPRFDILIRASMNCQGTFAYDLAERLLTEALMVARATKGAEAWSDIAGEFYNPSFILAREHLAYNANLQGFHARAREMFLMALAERDRFDGLLSPYTAQCRAHLIDTLIYLNEFDDAVFQIGKVAPFVDTEAFASREIRAQIMWASARCVDAAKQYGSAMELYNFVVPMFSGPELGPLQSDIALNFGNRGRYLEADRLHRAAIAALLVGWGVNHYYSGRALYSWSRTMLASGRTIDALIMGRRALKTLTNTLGGDHRWLRDAKVHIYLLERRFRRGGLSFKHGPKHIQINPHPLLVHLIGAPRKAKRKKPLGPAGMGKRRPTAIGGRIYRR